MRIIYEHDTTEDFIEIILSDRELENIKSNEGVVELIPNGYFGSRDLNVFIRREN